MVPTAVGRAGVETGRDDARLIRRRLVCRGTVQGVGFRPAVWRLATALELAGAVRNDADGATIEIEGAPERVLAFEQGLPAALPPLAVVADVQRATVPATGQRGFHVEASAPGRRERALIPPDTALCPRCRAELDDPGDRRHRHPFITCTDCGPRFSLVVSLPYDRERTSMAHFALCPDCAAEYRDPRSRRFHAEPTCCPHCGPTPSLMAPEGRVLARGAAALAGARETLRDGGIVAVKGLGGFQLACRADDPVAVLRLRQRKHRPTKPLAVMVRDLAAARRCVELTAAAEALLASPPAPILLAPRRADAAVAAGVAPGTGDLGVFLPTTPLHVELFRDAPFDALVMTSGNRSDEPICKDDEDARQRLAGIADRILGHDRAIVRRIDDSVVRSADDGPVLVRRSRGYVPSALGLPVAATEPVLALGGHLQTTACVAVGWDAVLSQHVGDLDHDDARAFLAEVAGGLEQFLQCRARVVVVDPHPDYASTWLGERLVGERGGRLLAVQHHLAHAAAVLGEHAAFPRTTDDVAAAIVLDGTGFGPDGTAWGGEWLCVDGDLRWARLASLQPLPLIGGERAVREPWRVAVAALAAANALELVAATPLAALVDGPRLAAAVGLARAPTWPRASGAGRLFEAVGALLGLGTVNGYEGELAVRLEALAAAAEEPVEPWPEVTSGERSSRLPSAALVAAAARRLADGESLPAVALGFHATFAHLAARLAHRVFPAATTHIGLGGGCLVNRLLRRALREELAAVGREALLPRAVPPGDGGLSFGQVVLGAAATSRGLEPRFAGER